MNTRISEGEYKQVKQWMNQYLKRNRRVVTFAELADHCQAPLGTIVKIIYDSPYATMCNSDSSTVDNRRRREII